MYSSGSMFSFRHPWVKIAQIEWLERVPAWASRGLLPIRADNIRWGGSREQKVSSCVQHMCFIISYPGSWVPISKGSISNSIASQTWKNPGANRILSTYCYVNIRKRPGQQMALTMLWGNRTALMIIHRISAGRIKLIPFCLLDFVIFLLNSLKNAPLAKVHFDKHPTGMGKRLQAFYY